jgi:hypothetical protein
MQLTLTPEDALTLRDMLRDHLPELQREAAAVELGHRELRHELFKRQDLCERLLAELDQHAQPGKS